jgi:hypothetical protein
MEVVDQDQRDGQPSQAVELGDAYPPRVLSILDIRLLGARRPVWSQTWGHVNKTAAGSVYRGQTGAPAHPDQRRILT